jgi:hypothetical protein
MKKSNFLALLILLFATSNIYAASVSETKKYRNPLLNQQSDRSLYNTCGAMSLLIMNNHYAKGNPGYGSTQQDVKSAVERLYSYLGKRNLNEFITHDDIRKVLKDKWNYSQYSKAYEGLEQMKNRVLKDVLTIALLKKGTALTNSIGSSVDHWVVVTGVRNNGKMIIYLDPWDGKLKRVSSLKFSKSYGGLHVYGKP